LETSTHFFSAFRPVSSTYKWWVVAMLWWVCFFNYADRQSMYAVFPALRAEFGFDPVQLGLIGSAFMWVYAAGAPLAGFICDRLSRKTLILGGCLFWSGITMLTGSCSQFWQFVTVRALEGLGETFYFPASMALLSDYHDRRTRSRALAFHQSSVYIGTILGSGIGAWIAVNYGWRIGFYWFGSMGIVLALALYCFLREPVRGAAESIHTADATPDASSAETPLSVRQTWRSLFRTPVAPLLMLAFVGANLVATIFLTWTPTFLVDKFGFKLAAAGVSGVLFIHLASAVSVPVAGWLADRLSQRFSGGRIMVQAMGLLVGAGWVMVVGETTSVTWLLIAMTAFGVCKGFYDSGIFAALYDVVEPRARGTAAGLMNAVGWGGGALGPLWVGLATQYGSEATEIANMSNAIAWGGAVYLCAALCLVIAVYRYPPHFPTSVQKNLP